MTEKNIKRLIAMRHAGYGRGGYGSYSTNLLNENGTINMFGMLGDLGEQGLGMGYDDDGNPHIPIFYEMDQSEIKYSKKHFGTLKQKGVWALGWRSPGMPDGIPASTKPISLRPGGDY